MKTYQPKQKDIKRDWHLIDAEGKVLGRIATDAARLLIGKHKPNYAPHLDMGDYVVVINVKEVKVTGRKEKQKVYRSHSGYPGGFKEVKFSALIKKSPEKVIEYAVSGMLPKNRLRDDRLRRLKVFAGSEHKYKDKIKGTSQ
ncbi:50S ribosomal protein L13 [Candidatus Woesebacteria bacterium]|nr:50S ribosomal protein L13 [Candidatus Woesebacteria bacterium]